MSVTHFATLAAVGITSLFIGFWYGSSSTIPTPTARSGEDGSEISDEEESHDYDLSAIKAGSDGELIFKMGFKVLCVRTDLKMTPGKIAAHCGHATLSCYRALSQSNPALLGHWEATGQAKVALKCLSEEQLLLLQAKARSLNLCARAIEDAGCTEINPGTLTVVGIGPGPVDLVDRVTGKLRLL